MPTYALIPGLDLCAHPGPTVARGKRSHGASGRTRQTHHAGLTRAIAFGQNAVGSHQTQCVGAQPAGPVPPQARMVLTKLKQGASSVTKQDSCCRGTWRDAGISLKPFVSLASRFLQLCENHPALRRHWPGRRRSTFGVNRQMRLPCRPDMNVFPVCRGCDSHSLTTINACREATLRCPTPKMVKADRWSQLWLGLVCMILIANLQYAWTLFVNPMHQANGWSIAGIQVAFSIFIATETWLTPVEGWVVDALGPRRGPPIMIGFGAVLVGARLGARRLRRFARHALCRRGNVRRRRRRDLRHLRRQRGEVVPRPARPRRRHHRRPVSAPARR